MYTNIKSIVSKITDRGKESSPNSSGENEEDTSSKQDAEGFLCPKCMMALPSPEELQAHYESLHGADQDQVSSGTASTSSSVAGFLGLHQVVGERYSRNYQEGIQINQEKLAAEVQGITDVSELQKSLMDALESKAQIQTEKEDLERRNAQLNELNASLKASYEEEQTKHKALKERLDIVESQLSHRESIDDAAVLRQELVQVQRVMDQMARDREEERDKVKSERDLLVLKVNRLTQKLETVSRVYEFREMKESLAHTSNLLAEAKTMNIILEGEAERFKDTLSAEQKKYEKLSEEHALVVAERDELRNEVLQAQGIVLKSSYSEGSCASGTNIAASVDQKDASNTDLLETAQHSVVPKESEKTDPVIATEVEVSNVQPPHSADVTDSVEAQKRLLEIEELNKTNSKMARELHEIKKSLSAANKALKACQEEMDEKVIKFNAIEQKNSELEKSIAAAYVNLEKVKDDASLEVRMLQSVNTDAQQKFSILQYKHQDLKENTAVMANKIEDYAKLIKNLQSQHIKSTQDADELIVSYESRLSEQKTIAEENKQAIENLKAEHEAAVAKLEAAAALEEKNKEIHTKAIQELQAALDEVSGEKLALEALLEASQTEQKILLEKFYQSSVDNEAQRHTVDEVRRRLEDSQSALHELGRENQILQLELEKLLGRKWTEDSDAAHCKLCMKEFSLLIRKHHCRNCGQIFCSDCSNKNAPLADNKKPVRVCNNCYHELASAK